MVTFKKKSHAKRTHVENTVAKLDGVDFLMGSPIPFLQYERRTFLESQVHPQMVSWLRNPGTINNGWPEALDPAIDVKLHHDRAMRKRQQIVAGFKAAFDSGLLFKLHQQSLLLESTEGPGIVMVDFGCGSGHLGLLFAWALPKLIREVVLIDTKDVGLLKAQERANKLSISNRVRTLQKDIADWFSLDEDAQRLQCTPPFQFQFAVSLHSCGSLTDLSLMACESASSSFCLIPCCYGQLQSSKTPESAPLNRYIQRPQSEVFKKHHVDLQTFDTLASCADFSLQSSKPTTKVGAGQNAAWDFSSQENYGVAKSAMRTVDLDRLLALKEHRNYQILWQDTLEPIHCSPKNNVICGVFRSHHVPPLQEDSNGSMTQGRIVTLEDILSVPYLGKVLCRFLPYEGFGSSLLCASKLCASMVRETVSAVELRRSVPFDCASALISRLNQLVKLDLSDCKNLSSVPGTVSLLSGTLRVLVLNFNPKMAHKPQDGVALMPGAVVGSLHRLEELYLSGCNLTGLGGTLGKLSKLRVLDISENPLLEQFPAIISKLRCLEELDISITGLQCVPHWLGTRCEGLKVLKAKSVLRDAESTAESQGEKRLIQMGPGWDKPSGLSGFNNVVDLDLSMNLFNAPRHTDWFFGQLDVWKSIRVLDLRWTNLSVIPDALQLIAPQVVSLSLDYNGISSIPSWFAQEEGFTSLEVLSIRSTLVSDFPSTFENLKKMRVFDATHTCSGEVQWPQKDVVPPWTHWHAVDELRLEFDAVCSYKRHELPPVKAFELMYSTRSMVQMPDSDMEQWLVDSLARAEGEVRLFSVSLASCITHLSFAKTITDLSLVKANLETVPPQVAQLHNLEKLNFAFNNIREWGLSKLEMSRLVYLKEMDIRGHKLSAIPDAFEGCICLRTLNMSSGSTLLNAQDVFNRVKVETNHWMLSIRELNLSDTLPTLESYSWISHLKKLRRLVLIDNDMSAWREEYLFPLEDLYMSAF